MTHCAPLQGDGGDERDEPPSRSITQRPTELLRDSNLTSASAPSLTSLLVNSRRATNVPSGLRTSMTQWPWTLMPSCGPPGGLAAGSAVRTGSAFAVAATGLVAAGSFFAAGACARAGATPKTTATNRIKSPCNTDLQPSLILIPTVRFGLIFFSFVPCPRRTLKLPDAVAAAHKLC